MNNLQISPKLKKEHKAYLIRFAETRRTRQSPRIFNLKSDRIREEAGLPAKPEYFVGIKESRRGPVFGISNTNTADFNNPPVGQPGLWCNWVPDSKGKTLNWNGNEDSAHHVEWLKYVISHFLKPWKYMVNGEVEIYNAKLKVKNNKISSEFV